MRSSTLCFATVVWVVWSAFAAERLPAREPAALRGSVAFLTADSAQDGWGAETTAAYALARKLAAAVLVAPAARGGFTDEEGHPLSLGRFRVIWMHQGDAPELASQFAEPGSLEALRQYAVRGGGLFLSGAALAWVHALGIEPARPRIARGGNDGYLAGLLPVVVGHPVFRGLQVQGVLLDESVGGNPREGYVPVTDAGYPAFADFFGSGGPRGGKLLARANAGAENPLVEYELGKGRVIAMGWRLPHYAHRKNAHRANLERLTGNILAYLSNPKAWQSLRLEESAPGGKPALRVPDGEWESLELALRDLVETFGRRYGRGPEYLTRFRELRRTHDRLLEEGNGAAGDLASRLEDFHRRFELLRCESLLDNPLLDFDRLLLVKRGAGRLGLPANFHGNSELPKKGFDNELAVLSPVRPDGTLKTLYRPQDGRFVGDVDLHFAGEKLLFSMPGGNGCWQVLELSLDDGGLRELPLIHEPDVDNFDACYLPDGRIIFSSTATFAGVPCVFGASHVTNLYLLGTDGSIRQLTVDQEHNWCPAVMNNGRVLYLRWEYTDLPHSNSRILFHMNPDGTDQTEYYGSNSFFPNSFFYARPIPGHPTKVVGIATGHHGVARAGRMLVLDPARGRQEASGVAQEIPGRGKKVEAIIKDNLVDDVWPKFLHPFPLSEKYFLVSAQLAPGSPWGIYLADVFDNLLLIKKAAGYALLEPIPLQRRPRPPALPDRVDCRRKDAVVLLTDVYQGGGLKGVPRGTVKKLRLFAYHYSYRGMGGLLGSIGMDGPWDIKMVLGTVPVERDGSARFVVPANTPIAVQPLDEEGQALQIMRSWFTAMPGEALSCVGCHEGQNTTTPNRDTLAARRAPSQIEPWYGPVRGFSFEREVQPVLDRYCVGCHDGEERAGRTIAFDLRGERRIHGWSTGIAGHVSPQFGGKFSVSYTELHRFVRRPGIESDIRLLSPMEFHAGSTELVQLLRKGHYGVELDDEAWDRLVTWIDLNAPYHGTWSEIVGRERVAPLAARRRELSRRYAGREMDPEVIPQRAEAGRPVLPVAGGQRPARPLTSPDWTFSKREARRRQVASGFSPSRTVELADGVALELVYVPAGEFVMGDSRGHPDERPRTRVKIEKPFWVGKYEVTNEQFALFDPAHDSRVEPMHGYQFGIHGYPVNKPLQPVVRLSWQQATAFCEWLSRKTGERAGLPTEAQWEWACRAGTRAPLWYGDLDTDFSRFANLGDAKLREFALDTYIRVRLVPNPNRYDDWVPKDDRFNDGGFVSVRVGSYQPNPWGLHDMHGNVWEWTRSLFRPYPYREDDGRNDPAVRDSRVVRGGSWYDRPQRCRSGFRLAYRPYQRVFNVGFRVVLEIDGGS